MFIFLVKFSKKKIFYDVYKKINVFIFMKRHVEIYENLEKFEIFWILVIIIVSKYYIMIIITTAIINNLLYIHSLISKLILTILNL